MRRIRRGDRRAFDEIVERHRAAATAVARQSCGPDLAEEVVQSAFMSLWQHRATYRPDRGSPRGWLLAIVRNRGIDLLRSRASRQRHLVVADPHGWMLAAADDTAVSDPPDALVERAESSARVRELLAQLPPAQRAVIEMAYLDGISQAQIALTLGVPLGTVKGRLRLGLAKLRVAYEEPGEMVPAAA